MYSTARMRLLSFAAAAFAVGKLVLSAVEEVVARVYSSEQYATMALQRRSGDYTAPVGFPVVASVLHTLGIPYRIGIELIYVATCWAVARALLGTTGSLLLSLVTLAGLALHPWSMGALRYFYPDSLFACAALGA